MFKMKIILSFFILMFVSSTPIASGKIIYVDDDAAGANDGSNWVNAYMYLQDALADANDSEKPVEIRVAQGVYKPDQGASQTPGDPNATFQLFNSVILKGGYAGVGEPDPNLRDIEGHETVLSGDLAGDDVRVDYTYTFDLTDHTWIFHGYQSITDNSFRILTATTTDSNTLLDGFVISAASYGAGLYTDRDSNITVKNCVFTENAASGIFSEGSNSTITDCVFSNNGTDSGGGISILDGSPYIISCTFSRNLAGLGGGIYNIYGDPQIISCIFKDNYTAHYGAGLCNEVGRLWLEDCIFTRNVGDDTESYGGGIYSGWSHASSIISNCKFDNNFACEGGGIYYGRDPHSIPCRFCPTFSEEKFLLTGCTFTRNQAFRGGAIYSRDSTLEARHCIFSGNSALGNYGLGGAVLALSNIINFNNCFFTGNYAEYSGASISASWGLTLDNCTLAGNLCPDGWALLCAARDSEKWGNTFISNCIFDNGENEIRISGDSQITLAYTNLRGGIDTIYDPREVLIWSDSNIDVDPLFVNPGYWDTNSTMDNMNDDFWIEGDYRLKSQAGRYDPNSRSWVMDDVTSPCIDAGDPNSPVGDEPEPNGSRINMGAYGGTDQASKSYLVEP
jgi:parallel beta-helix repeat protein/predicted outer membrane repeat protein